MNKLFFILIAVAVIWASPDFHRRRQLFNNNNKREGLLNDNLGVVNGEKSIKMIPFLCSFREFGVHICGCSILNEKIILTAAHCVQKGYPADVYEIGVGSVNLAEQTLYEARQYLYHEKYNETFKFNNDVALIKLIDPIQMRIGEVSTVTLYNGCSQGIPYHEVCTIAGWGYLNETHEVTPENLYEADVVVLKNIDLGCSQYQAEGKLSDTMLCSGHASGAKDSCKGDSGGVLWNKLNEQVGIVSWGRGCARANFTGIYTNICAVLPWINANINF